MFTLADFVFSTAISRQVARAYSLDVSAKLLTPDLISTQSGWDGVAALIPPVPMIFGRTLGAVVLLVAVYEFVAPFTNWMPQRTNETTLVWYLIAGSFAFMIQTKLSQAFLDGLGFMYVGRFVGGTYQIITGTLSIVILWFGGGSGLRWSGC